MQLDPEELHSESNAAADADSDSSDDSAENMAERDPLLGSSNNGGRRRTGSGAGFKERSRNKSYTNEDVDPSLYSQRNWWGFFLLGTLNNFSFVVVTSGSKALAESFNELQLLGVLQWASVGAGLFVRSLNAFVLEGVPTSTRVNAAAAVFLVGYIGLTISPLVDFWLAVVSIVLIGGACSFGESVLLGFMRRYPVQITGGWSSGTGMAGVGGSLFYMLCWFLLHSRAGCDTKQSLVVIYFLMVASVPLYLFSYYVIVTRSSLERFIGSPPPLRSKSFKAKAGDKSRKTHQNGGGLPRPTLSRVTERSDEAEEDAANDDERGLDGLAPSSYQTYEETEGPAPHTFDADVEASLALVAGSGGGGGDDDEPTLDRALRVTGLILNPAMQLCAVYFFEYCVSVGFAAHAVPKLKPGQPRPEPSLLGNFNGFWDDSSSFVVLAFCYQAGVLISRSSLEWMRWGVDRVWILTALQVRVGGLREERERERERERELTTKTTRFCTNQAFSFTVWLVNSLPGEIGHFMPAVMQVGLATFFLCLFFFSCLTTLYLSTYLTIYLSMYLSIYSPGPDDGFHRSAWRRDVRQRVCQHCRRRRHS